MRQNLAQNMRVIEHITSDFNEPLQNQFVQIVAEVQAVLQNEQMNDFYNVEEIVEIYESHGISTGNCHDFG